MKRKEVDFPSLSDAAAALISSLPASHRTAALPSASGKLTSIAAASSAKERLLRVPASKLGLLVKCMAKVCGDRMLEAIMEEFEAMEAEEQRRSLTSRLPEELLCDVLEFTMETVKEIGPLSLVSKAFGHCVKLPQMLERVTLKIPEEMLQDWDSDWRELDEEAMDEKRALLEVYLREAGEQFSGLGRLEIDTDFEDNTSVVHNDTIGVLASVFPELKSLSLSYFPEVSDVNSLSSLTSLAHLTLHYSSLADSGIRSLAQLTALRSLDLTASQITHAGPLASMAALETLDLSGCDELTDEGLRPLSSLRRLRCLSLSGNNQLTGEGLQYVPVCVTKLDLCYCSGLADEWLEEGLTRLTLLEDFNLGRTNIGDAGVRAVSSLPLLTDLDLRHCKSITDAGFSSLSALASLQSLEVYTRDIGAETLRALRGALPTLTIS